ncbi:hypothetical protein LPW26_24525 [Rhodopseudomonas sp. HC1]|uniref:hypothetical protein n=1 Tax=Rhodopseudomonas infernalis TaxID=2897386 RepID=UPI001EE98144|nr:hypothetical protein [Rhodopseudomonas infernalis]MCG6207827.1 hypothetical protein [Rhodopseudomonas infernalis]
MTDVTMEGAMSEPVTQFPNLLVHDIKAFAPAGVAFWQTEETILAGMKEFAEGWFERRRIGTHAALEAAKLISQAATPLDALREYQDWLGGAFARVLEDGMAFQQQLTKANARIASRQTQTESGGPSI